MKKRISILLCMLIIFTFHCTIGHAEIDSLLPSPDWITITSNRDGTKNASITTPTYLLDSVAFYEYSIDGGNTWQTINNSDGGDIVISSSCELQLKYTTIDTKESIPYSASIEINSTTVVTDSSTGISLLIPNNSATPTDVTLSCYEIISGVDYSSAAEKIGKNKDFMLFHITLMHGHSVFNAKSENTFMFPTRNLDNRYCKLYYIDSSGNIEILDSINEMNVLYVNTAHYGIFAVVEDKTFAKGDVNGDAKINAADARLALRASAQLETLGDMQFISADVDGNGTVTSSDARMILRAAAGLEKI